MRRPVAVLLIVSAASVLAGVLPARAQPTPPPDTRAMTDDELAYFFTDRSWITDAGVGYFSDQESEYLAAAASGESGRGRWSLPGSGKVCTTTWWKAGGKLPKLVRECFSYRTDGRRVYQRREPNGEWVLFKDAPPVEWPRKSRLVPSNYFAMPVNLLAK